MLVKIQIFDVLDNPISKATIYRIDQWGNTISTLNLTGNEISFDSSEIELFLKVTHPDFFNEELRVTQNGTFWSNKTCKVTKSDSLNIIFVLSQVREAPTVYIPEEQLRRMQTSPEAILLGSNDAPYNYRGLSQRNVDGFRILAHPILGNPNGREWERLRCNQGNAEPMNKGRFRWVEYRLGRENYVIAVWVPKNYFYITGKTAIDYFVFYTPTTGGKSTYKLERGQRPPYGIKNDSGYIRQPFVDLGHDYLFTEGFHYLAYQLIVANKNAITLVPINNLGDWAPVFGKDSLFRCLREVSHYLHKTSLLTTYYIDRSYGEISSIPISLHQPIPIIGNIAVGAFSEGYQRLKVLFSGHNKLFDDNWREIWDIDCAVSGYGGFEEFHKLLKTWHSSNRRFRMFHSDITAAASQWRPSQLKRFFGKGILNHPKGKVKKLVEIRPGVFQEEMLLVEAEEFYALNESWSAVYFSNPYITIDKDHDSSVRPAFIADAHGFVPNIGIGYAAAKSVF